MSKFKECLRKYIDARDPTVVPAVIDSMIDDLCHDIWEAQTKMEDICIYMRQVSGETFSETSISEIFQVSIDIDTTKKHCERVIAAIQSLENRKFRKTNAKALEKWISRSELCDRNAEIFDAATSGLTKILRTSL